MGVSTRSKWYYGHVVDENNLSIDFDEGSGELNASLDVGDYTLEEYGTEVARAMNEVGTQTYSVSISRSTRVMTISASSNFSLLISTGTNSTTSAWSLMGFTGGSDLTGSNSYSGSSGSGKEYIPQAVLYSYIPFNDIEEAVEASVNQTATGKVEVISFGDVKFMECEIRLISDITQSVNSPISTNANARSEARDFLSFARKKNRMEFMEDKDTPGTFNKCILESSAGSRDGTSFQLEKMFDEGVIGYYETGRLRFREVV